MIAIVDITVDIDWITTIVIIVIVIIMIVIVHVWYFLYVQESTMLTRFTNSLLIKFTNDISPIRRKCQGGRISLSMIFLIIVIIELLLLLIGRKRGRR